MVQVGVSLAIGVIGSLTASVIFLLLARSFRPRIEISRKIAEWGSDDNRSHVIKILNHSKRSVVDLRFELLLITLKSVPDGVLRSTRPISLSKPEAFILHGFSKADKDARFARRIVVNEDLNDVWTNDEQQFLVFRVYGHDEVSGLAKLFEVEYRTIRNSMVSGQFHSGNTLEIS